MENSIENITKEMKKLNRYYVFLEAKLEVDDSFEVSDTQKEMEAVEIGLAVLSARLEELEN